jgi:hypothetical protein
LKNLLSTQENNWTIPVSLKVRSKLKLEIISLMDELIGLINYQMELWRLLLIKLGRPKKNGWR